MNDPTKIQEVTIKLQAMEPMELLRHPIPVFVRLLDEVAIGSAGGRYVLVRGTPDDVASFVAEHWGMDDVEAHPEIAGLVAPGLDEAL